VDPIAHLNAALEGRYHIERQLGAGGMATVYLARELRHNRNVALKVLKPDLAAAVGGDAFLAEINTTANLQHPHILPLHDSGNANGLLFYTMPYVEGETLRQRLDRERRLPPEDAVRIAIEIAEALQAAHDAGVIHRDIKPSNILLSRGKALVADFGIARVVRTSDATERTEAATLLGTVGYMSPEQASGSAEVDHRSDIYSLGCLLFEVLTGEPPYAGRTLLEVLSNQATQPVPSLRSRRSDLPVELDRIVSASLAKDPSSRFTSAAAFAAALLSRHAPQAVATPLTTTIVVLPFVNRSSDADNEYFSDGLTDEVTSDLSRVSALRVISRNSAMALKGTTKDTRTLARELGVTHLVTGTVRRAGSSLRITADLVDASTDTPIWAEKFSGSIEDVFGIQEHISREIVSALKVTLTAAESRGVAERPIDDPVAYDCYLRACHQMYHWTPEAQQLTVRLVDEAIAIVGETPLLLAMKGQLQWNLVNLAFDPAEAGLDRAAALADRALALDPHSYLAIFVRGLVHATRGRPEVGLIDLYRAHHLNPADANVLLEVCRYSLAAGLRNPKQFVDRLVAIDPLRPQSPLCLAMYYGLHGPAELAAQPARRSIELSPEPSLLHCSAGVWLAIAGQRAEAAAIFDRLTAFKTDLRGTFASFFKCAIEGDADGALRVITPEMERSFSNEFLCLMIATGYAWLDRKDDAVRMLRAAVGLGFINYPHLTASALAESLKTHREYEALVAAVKPRWEAVVAWERGLQS
jgi:serine/threonine protein kinase